MRYSALCKSDRNLIDDIASYWVADGGDVDGFVFCIDAIKERIAEVKSEQAAKDQEDSAS